jgi:hypothetical protein
MDLGTNSVCFPVNVFRHFRKTVRRDYSFVIYVCLSVVPRGTTLLPLGELLLYVHTYCSEQSPSWEANRFVAIKKFPYFMQPEGSLPHSQLPATFLYPEPAQSSPHLHIPLLRSILILSSHLRLGLPQWSLSLGFPHQNSVHASLLPTRATCSAHLILDFITRTILGEEWRQTSHYEVCSTPLLPRPS